jgi:O-antigen/teichoic acid export membrane protein
MTNFISRIKNRIAHGQLGEGRFVRNVLTILAGTAFSQAISLAVMPILARLFDPADFGLLATFTAVANMLAMFACLSYQGAIILPRRHEAAFTLWAACIGLTVVMSLLMGVLLFAFAEPLVEWLGNPALSGWLWLVPVSVAAWGVFEATSLWATRNKAFADLSSAMVQKRLALSGSQLLLGLNAGTRNSGGLISGQVVGELTGVIVLVRKALRSVPRRYWSSVRWLRIRVLLHRYRRFPMYDLASSFAAALARAMPVIVLGIYFSPAIVGFFAMANRLVAAPMQLGITSITRVFFERANRAKVDGNLASMTAEVYSRLCIILLTPLALLAIAAPDLISILLGAQWEESGHYLRWLCLWFFFVSTASPLHRLFAVLERQDELAIINGVLFIVSAGALIAGGMLGDARLTLALFAVSSSLVWFAQGVRVLHIAGVNVATLAGILSEETLRALPFVAILLAAQLWLDNSLAISACLLIVGASFAIIRLRRIFSLAPGSLTKNN